MNQQVPVAAVAEPPKPPTLAPTAPRRWHTVIIRAPEGTVSHVSGDAGGVLEVDLYAPGEQVGRERRIQEVTTWSEKGAADL